MKESLLAIRARRKLRLTIALFAILLAFPLGLLVLRVYSQLRMESFIQYRATAEELVTQVNSRLNDLISTEEKRAFDEYSFFSVASNSLIRNQWVGVSPLSRFPQQSAIPGVVGYFEMTPDGDLRSPLVPPDVSDGMLGDGISEAGANGLGSAELESRRGVLRRLREVLLGSKGLPAQLERERTKAKDVEEVAAPLGQQLDQLKLDERYYRGDAPSGAKSYENRLLKSMDSAGFGSVKREARKEQLNVVTQAAPLQSKAPPLSELVQGELANEIAPALAKQKELKKSESTKSESNKQPDFQVSVVEGEVDPLQVTLLQDGHFAFYRKVWRNKQRFIQGFVVDARRFIEQLVQGPFEARQISNVLTMIVAYRGQVFQVFGAKPAQMITDARQAQAFDTSSSSAYSERASSVRDVLVFRANAMVPLTALELVFTSPGLPWGSRSNLVDVLLLSLCLILALGFFFLYRLGVAQIALAEQQSNFVSAVSHELKTPLTSIRMYGEMLRSGVVADEAKRNTYYDYIFHESERLSRLIANVLQMARLSRDRDALPTVVMTVGAVLDLARSKVSSAVEAAGFTLTVAVDDEIKKLELRLEEDAIIRAFINLVDNALKFSKAATRREIIIGARVPNQGSNSVDFFVRDFGPGVDQAQKRKLFQLFYRAESELTRSTPGTGIGLALVRELVARMHGSVDVQNENPGAEFRLRFSLNRPLR